jgi:glycosyltransferase involved in cell wall biosynthesis
MSVRRRPRVLHLTTTGAIAGAEQLLVDLSQAHHQDLWDVAYCTLFVPGEMNRIIVENGGVSYGLGVKSSLDIPAAILRLTQLIRSLKLDVLHTHLLHAGLVGLIAARLSGRKSLKLVHTRHHSDELHRFGPSYRAKLDAFVASSHHLVCANSLAAKAVLEDLEGISPSKIRVTYPGVNITQLVSKISDPEGINFRQDLGLSSQHLLIGSVAHLLPKKGHAVLLEAMVSVRSQVPSARLIVAGRGRESERLRQLTEQLGLNDVVQFLGYRNDIPNLMNACDIMVQPSLEEAFGVSLVEAMAIGRPIVGSNVGGIPEVVENGVTGFLVTPGVSDLLAKSLVDLLRNPTLRKDMGVAGQARAKKLFTIEKHAADYEAVWSELLT